MINHSKILQKMFIEHNIKTSNIVPFHPETDRIKKLNLSNTNPMLTPDVFNNTERFTAFIEEQLHGARYGIGGYMENRTVYSRSRVFDGTSEPRTLHLGVDIWGTTGTPVIAPIDGIVHSKGNHPEYGNYGATLLLQHQIEEVIFYTLYGHLSKKDLLHEPGAFIASGTTFAQFGPPEENGHWPPHLHFQVILDLQGSSGDYPGVCAISEQDFYQKNCPDPAIFMGGIMENAR